MADESMQSNRNAKRDTNPDAITGAPGSHPVGTGVGAAGGGAAGAAIGTALLPGVGTVVGAVVGAVAGGYAGKGGGEMIDPSGEREHWEKTYQSRPYVKEGDTFDAYEPAYQYGWESRARHQGKTFDEAAPHLEHGWDKARGKAEVGWDEARPAVRDAWDRVDGNVTSRATSGGSTSLARTESHAGDRPADQQAIPVVEEQLLVGKREVERGGVRVQTSVSERPVEAQVNLREEHVRVDRHRTDRPAGPEDVAAAARHGAIEVTEKSEVPVVAKEARVVEEVVVGKEAAERTETVRETVRRTEVEVEQLHADAPVESTPTEKRAGRPS